MPACPACGAEVERRMMRYAAGQLSVDWGARTICWKQQPVVLTPTQIEIVDLLARRPEMRFSPRAIADAILDDETGLRTVRVHICNINKRFRAIDPGFDAIRTHWGLGYFWRAARPH